MELHIFKVDELTGLNPPSLQKIPFQSGHWVCGLVTPGGSSIFQLKY